MISGQTNSKCGKKSSGSGINVKEVVEVAQKVVPKVVKARVKVALKAVRVMVRAKAKAREKGKGENEQVILKNY